MQGLGAASGPQLWKLLDRTGSWAASPNCSPNTWPTGSPVQGSLLGVPTLCRRCPACPTDRGLPAPIISCADEP